MWGLKGDPLVKNFRVRGVAASVLAAALLTPIWARTSPQEEAEAVRRRVEAVLEEELARLRASLVATVRQELERARGGQELKGLDLITEDLLKKHAGYLASDELQGRQAGYEGNNKASEYIAGVMKKAGLAPVGDKDDKDSPTYFQAFKVARKPTRNCVGLLAGSDPKLKDEILVVGAHFDHLGKNDDQGPPGQRGGGPRGDDDIWNGADDNGSGTTTLLGLIKAFGEGGLKPKRSILFIAFSGEEAGLVGSFHYVAHPIVPIARHVFMLNLDMVGRNPDKPVKIDGVGSAEGPRLRKTVEEAAAATGLKASVNDAVTVMGGDSDHTPFRRAGVPFVFFFSGFHPDYHRVTDHADKLAYENMVKVGKTAGKILMSLADADETLASRPLDFPRGGGGQARRTLGIQGKPVEDDDRASSGLGKEEGGVMVDQVGDNTVAAAAGLEDGDIIVKMDGKPLAIGSEMENLRELIAKAAAGKEIEILVIRGKDRKTLKAKWEK